MRRTATRRTIKRTVTTVTTTTWTVQWAASLDEAGEADPTAAAPVSEPALPAPEPQDTEIKSANEKEALDEVKGEEDNQPSPDGSSA